MVRPASHPAERSSAGSVGGRPARLSWGPSPGRGRRPPYYYDQLSPHIFAWDFTFLICSNHFYCVESSSHFGESLALREEQAGLRGSHLCPKRLAWGRPCVFPGVAVLSEEPGEDVSLSEAGSLNLSGVLAPLTT